MNCHDARRMLHQALDDDLSLPARQQLKSHVQACGPCQKTQHSLEQVVSLLDELANEPAPSNFTDDLMQQLPATRYRTSSRRMRAACAVALIFLMVASPIFVWSTLSKPQLVAEGWPAILQEGNRFIVPSGAVVKGDAVIYKGILEIQGEVQGTIKTLDASIEMGPKGKHVGQIRSIDASPKAKLAVALAELWERVKGLLGSND